MNLENVFDTDTRDRGTCARGRLRSAGAELSSGIELQLEQTSELGMELFLACGWSWSVEACVACRGAGSRAVWGAGRRKHRSSPAPSSAATR